MTPPRPRTPAQADPQPVPHGPLPGQTPDPALSDTPTPATPAAARDDVRLLTYAEDAGYRAHMLAAWDALAAPFPDDEHELLPKPTSRDNRKGSCRECGGYHGLPAVHLTYVGHAGITTRLNAVDPLWQWEPVAWDANGLPLIDANGGLWIRLTVLGHTRLGYGDAEGKRGASAVKETIGDAIRNAAMRFGVGTYLWSKSEKAAGIIARSTGEVIPTQAPPPPPAESVPVMTPADVVAAIHDAARVMGKDVGELTAKFRKHQGDIAVDALDTLDLMVLVDFRRSLEPYVTAAMRQQDAEQGDPPPTPGA